MQKISRFFIITFLLSSHFLAHSMAVPYHSAGILPYAIDNQKKWLLVGLEPYRNNQAFDFGGKKDPEDHDNSRYTAAREGTEELLFLYDDANNFDRIVKIYNAHKDNFQLYKADSKTYHFFREAMKHSATSESRGYITYFVKIDYNPELPKNFINRRKSQRLPGSWIEKNQLVWLSLDEIVTALKNNSNDNAFSVSGIKIFPHFAQSLRTAWQNGTLAQLR